MNVEVELVKELFVAVELDETKLSKLQKTSTEVAGLSRGLKVVDLFLGKRLLDDGLGGHNFEFELVSNDDGLFNLGGNLSGDWGLSNKGEGFFNL